MCNSLKTASCGMRRTQASGGEQRSRMRTACARAGSLSDSAYTIAGCVPSIHALDVQAPEYLCSRYAGTRQASKKAPIFRMRV